MLNTTVIYNGNQGAVCVGIPCPDQIIGRDQHYYYAKHDDGNNDDFSQRIRAYIATGNRLILHHELTMAFNTTSLVNICVIEGHTYIRAYQYYRLKKDFTMCEPRPSIRHGNIIYWNTDVITNKFIYRNGRSKIVAIDRQTGIQHTVCSGHDTGSYRIFEVSDVCVAISSNEGWMYAFDDGQIRHIPWNNELDVDYDCIYVTPRGIVFSRDDHQRIVEFLDLNGKIHTLAKCMSDTITVKWSTCNYVMIVDLHSLMIFNISGTPILIHESTINYCEDFIFNVMLPCHRSLINESIYKLSDISIITTD